LGIKLAIIKIKILLKVCLDRYKNKVSNTSKVVGNLQIGLHVLFLGYILSSSENAY